MPATSATAIITGALDILGVVQAGQAAGGNDLVDGFRRLKNMLGQLRIQSLTAPDVGREVFPLVANKGGPSNPYTIGPGGDFDTTRPNSLTGVGLLLNASVPQPVEIPRTLYTDDAWESVQVKDLPSGLFTGLYYSLTYPLGTINLWPIPTTSLNSLVLYRLDQLGAFSTLTATYNIPDGGEEMLEYQLVLRLAAPYQRKVPDGVPELAADALATFKRQNYKSNDFATDPALTNSRRGGYNIDTGNL